MRRRGMMKRENEEGEEKEREQNTLIDTLFGP